MASQASTPIPSPRTTTGTRTSSGLTMRQRLTALLDQAGVDTTNPAVQQLINTPGYPQKLLEPANQALLQATAVTLSAKYPKPLSYQEYLNRPPSAPYGTQGQGGAGFDTSTWDRPSSLSPNVVEHGPGTRAWDPSAYTFTPNDYMTNANGDTLYRDGTMVTADGHIIYAPNSNAPGSARWQEQRARMSAADLKRECDRLLAANYITQSQYDQILKTGPNSGTFIDAENKYYTALYQNHGKEVVQDPASLGPAPIDFSVDRATIQAQVHTYFKSTFGREPTPGELTQWTDFVVKTANDMSKAHPEQGSGAETNALASLSEQFKADPYAQYAYDQTTGAPIGEKVAENTSLRDRLANAVAAMGSI